jgi:hypothetical protein
MSFFHIDEKTLKDIIEQQRNREAKRETGQTYEYDGHKLKFMTGIDGSIIIDAEPPLTKVVEGDKNAPAENVETLTQMGWVKKE